MKSEISPFCKVIMISAKKNKQFKNQRVRKSMLNKLLQKQHWSSLMKKLETTRLH